MAVPVGSRVADAVTMLGSRAAMPAELARLAVYRLLRVELIRQRGLDVDPFPVLGGLTPRLGPAEVDEVLAALRSDGGPGPDDVRGLGELHQGLLSTGTRRSAGAYFTPQPLIEHLLDETLEPALDERSPSEVAICDPSCGSGLFLVAAARRLLSRGVPVRRVLEHCVRGVELDPGAAELARTCLLLTAIDAGETSDLPDPLVHVGDALTEALPGAPYDVVVGNPPFLNRLERRTALRPGLGRALADRSGGAVRSYTDVSAVFLHQAVSWVRPGGRVALVQPQSLLAARDAAGVRARLAAVASLDSLWASDRPVFDAGVLTCAPVLRVGGAQGAVRRVSGPGIEPCAETEPGDLTGTWSHLVAEALGLPRVQLARRGHGAGRTVEDVAECTADFRDQYYGLRPHVREAALCPDGVPLVTAGLIDPAVSLWGSRPTRFLKQQWRAPVVDLESLRAEPKLDRWAAARRVPKVLLATQGRVIEAVADVEGGWLPSVPTITVVPRRVSLWQLLAVLLAPPLSVHAATTYAGAGLSMQAIKLSAGQVAALPLPCHDQAWDEGAELARAAQQAADPADRLGHLVAMGERMCVAYDVAPADVLPWWRDRLR